MVGRGVSVWGQQGGEVGRVAADQGLALAVPRCPEHIDETHAASDGVRRPAGGENDTHYRARHSDHHDEQPSEHHGGHTSS